MKKIPDLPDEVSEKILKLFESYTFPLEVILFGSRAKKTHREGSDIDLAVKSQLFSQNHRIEILNLYDSLYLPWKLDLIVYSTIEEQNLKDHIDRVGISLLKF